jgi:hypothetical protein
VRVRAHGTRFAPDDEEVLGYRCNPRTEHTHGGPTTRPNNANRKHTTKAVKPTHKEANTRKHANKQAERANEASDCKKRETSVRTGEMFLHLAHAAQTTKRGFPL